ncbi:MAG: AI-2E family transporter [Succiniclasticum sp.]|jgi:predicted PurR-regulated permease PerM
MTNNSVVKYIQQHTSLKILVLAVVSILMYEVTSVLLSVILSIGLAFALYPLTRAFGRIRLGKTGMHPSRVAAILLAFVALAVFLAVVVSFIVLPLFGQINELLQQMPAYTKQLQGDSLRNILTHPETGTPMLPSSLESLITSTIASVTSILTEAVQHLVSSTVDIVSNLVGLIIVPFLAFYFLKDWRELCRMIVHLFMPASRPKVGRILTRIGVAISGFVEGMWKLSILAAFFVTVTMLILGVPYPLVFGFIALLSETIPIVGAMMAAIPAIFVAFTSVSPQTAGYVALFYIVYYSIDSHVLQPEIMGRKVNLHPVIILLALLIGGKLFGIFGMLIATPVAAVYRVLYDELWYYDGEEEEFHQRAVLDRMREQRETGKLPDQLTLEEEVTAEEDAFAEIKAEKEAAVQMEEEARRTARTVAQEQEEARKPDEMGKWSGE